MNRKTLAYLPLVLLIGAMLFVYFSGIYHDLTFATIKEKHAVWKAAAHAHPVHAALYFIAIYVVSVCLVIPDSTLLSVLGGLLFPLPLAISYIVVSETIGAMIFFWVTRAAFAQTRYKRTSRALMSLQKKVALHPASYLLFFRFSHLLPFWVVNLAAACLSIRARTFFWTTLVGVSPLAYILAQGGAGLGHYFERNEVFSIEAIFNTEVKVALVCLGVLALVPIVLRRYRRHS